MEEPNKFLSDLITRLKKLSKEELEYVLQQVGDDSQASLDDIARDSDDISREVRLT